MPNYSLITVLFSIPLIFRYHLPLNSFDSGVCYGEVDTEFDSESGNGGGGWVCFSDLKWWF